MGTIFRETPEVFKNLAVSVYTKNYESFIKALSMYDSKVVNNLSQKEKNNIKDILKSKLSLQNKIDSLIAVFSETAVVNETLLLIFDTASQIISYIGEEELRDIITKMFVSQVKDKIFHLPSNKGRVVKKETTTRIEQEKNSVMELILEKCNDLSKSNRVQLEQKINSADNNTIKNCLKNSIISLTAKQIISFGHIFSGCLYRAASAFMLYFIIRKNGSFQTAVMDCSQPDDFNIKTKFLEL